MLYSAPVFSLFTIVRRGIFSSISRGYKKKKCKSVSKIKPVPVYSVLW
ncbi:hypothetical protein D083_1080 [Dickeya solani RNS 08.23.3.1.A]|nr:hypothetical protein D083_1080 [Dickeya solani RNS 08.23.3.1.A]